MRFMPYFGGKDKDIRMARQSGVTLPVLYKNFIIDEYQLFEARLCGASAVLLIAACLKKGECKTLLNMAHQLGLEVLLEKGQRSCRQGLSFKSGKLLGIAYLLAFWKHDFWT